MNRRQFVATMLGGTAGAALTGTPAEARPERILKFRPLGKTGIRVSEVILGSYGGIAPQVVARALELGVNYIDTAPDYRGNLVSEEVIGRVVKQMKLRDKIAIATKMCAPTSYPGHLRKGTPVKKIVESVEGSLKRLQTDHVDVLVLHGLGELDEGDVDRVKDDHFWEAFQKLKQAGKARFLGGGCHGPRQMVQIVEWMVESGRFDMMQVSYNFFNDTQFNFRKDGLDGVMAKAKQRGMGVMAMKTRSGARPQDIEAIQAKKQDFDQACLRWVLGNPVVSGVLITTDSVQHLENLVAAAQQPKTGADHALLQRYAQAFGDKRCRIGCGECLDACPQHVAIPTVLRLHTYFEAYSREKAAMQEYAGLPSAQHPTACDTCPAPCLDACPHGLDVRRMLLAARTDLTFEAQS